MTPSTNPARDEAVREAFAGLSLSEDAKAYWAVRGEAWRKVFAVLRDYRMTNMRDDIGGGYPLVDLMSNDDKSIATGQEEMVHLADEISAILSAAPAPASGVDAVAPAGWCLVPDEATGSMWEAGRTADQHPGDSYSAVYRAMIEARPEVPSFFPPMVVEPLEWQTTPSGFVWFAESAVGRYFIEERHSDFVWTLEPQPGRGYRNTLDEAKAAAQADYEQRIRSALSPAATSGSEAGGELLKQHEHYSLKFKSRLDPDGTRMQGSQGFETAAKAVKFMRDGLAIGQLFDSLTRVVTLSYDASHLVDPSRSALAKPSSPVRELLGSPDGWREQREALQMWTASGFLAGEPVKDEAWHKRELYSDLCRLVSWLHSAEEAARAALSPSTSAAEPVAIADLSYQTLFNAIAAATDIASGGLAVSISVEKFRDALGIAHPAPAAVETYQNRVATACATVFDGDPTDIAERRDRFAEEALETCQAFGMTREDMRALVDYTFGRPVGEPAKEIGAAMTTLASLCVYSGHNLMACAEADLAKLQRPETVARIRAKRATRHGRGSLPGLSEPAAVESGQGVKVKDWLAVAKAAGQHGIRYRTNRALEAFLSDVRAFLASEKEG